MVFAEIFIKGSTYTRARLLPIVGGVTHGGGSALAVRNAALRRHEAVKACLAAESAVAAAGAVRVRTAEPAEFVVPQAALGVVRASGPPSWTHY